MPNYTKILGVTAAAVAALSCAFLVLVLVASVLNSAVQGEWLRAAAHMICLLVAGAMIVLLTCYIEDNIC